MYADAVATQFHITLDQMFSGDRRRDIVDARQMLYFICMERPYQELVIFRDLWKKKTLSCEAQYYIHGYNKGKAKSLIDNDP